MSQIITACVFLGLIIFDIATHRYFAAGSLAILGGLLFAGSRLKGRGPAPGEEQR